MFPAAHGRSCSVEAHVNRGALWFGDAVGVAQRFARQVTAGMTTDGLTLEGTVR